MYIKEEMYNVKYVCFNLYRRQCAYWHFNKTKRYNYIKIIVYYYYAKCITSII